MTRRLVISAWCLLVMTGCGQSPSTTATDGPSGGSDSGASTPTSAAVPPGESSEPDQESAAPRQGEQDSAQQATGPDQAQQPSETQSAGEPLDLGEIVLTVPEGWEARDTGGSTINLAEFALPRAEGDEDDGRLTIGLMGGDVEANVNRWKGQFSGGPEKESTEEFQVAGAQVTLVDFSGNYQPPPFVPGGRGPGYRMLAAIIRTESKHYFVKCAAPEKTMAEHADAFHAFVRSLRQP